MLKDTGIFPTLITERLTLRQLSKEDAEEVFQLRTDPQINKYLDRKPSKTLGDALNFINNINENIKNNESYYWAILMTGKEKLIGTICLFDFSKDKKNCEIGYELLTEYQGNGIMLEAIKKVIEYANQILGVKTIDALIHKENRNSIKLVQKLNFKKLENINEENQNLILFRLTY
ncbi:GNAT family N-acetyltransferase [Flavobacterium sp.]|uniref:GNAT family N-acetyltransferase n=1 Tax=Flavobacterium sp. TaxID=239 RepID=UPI002BB1E061|nr:GNAT family N-acetyltransferase [Flavobacterium sp.]HSD08651.1 GNAT family N-acetyltransferase [Flavobacterium sp.]